MRNQIIRNTQSSIFIISFFLFGQVDVFSQNTGTNDNMPGLPGSNCSGMAGDTALRKLQTVFVKNQGQVKDDILYYSWFPQGISIYKDRINIYGTDVKMNGHGPLSACVKGQQITNYRQPAVEGKNLQQGIFNYFGNNKSISNIPSYGEVVYVNIYPNIDLILAGMKQGEAEFIWSIHPGGRVEDICLEIKGAKIKRTDADEILVTPKRKNARPFTIGNIYAYQACPGLFGDKEKIEMRYCIKNNLPPFGKVELGFLAGRYDKSKTLIIDPVVAATLITGTGTDDAYALAIDGTGGNVFVAGHTDDRSDFAPSSIIHGAAGSAGAFVTKLSNNLSTHIATAIITSSAGSEVIRCIAIDGAGGNIFVAGQTGNYADFAPSRIVFGTTGGTDVFVTKLSNDLSTHTASAIIASSANSDYAHALAINNTDIFVAGETGNQADFAPNRTVFGTTGGIDAFVTKFNNALSSHTATAILAGGGNDVANAIAIDGVGGNVFAAGKAATSSNFATARTTYGSNPGSGDAFVTKLDNALSSHTATSVLVGGDGTGGTGADGANAIAIDGVGGNVFVAGTGVHITSPCCGYKFAVSPQYVHNSGYPAAFVTKFDNALVYTASALIGSDAEANAIAINGAGNIIIAGSAPSTYASSKSPAIYGTPGGREAFATKLSNDLSSHIATAIVAGSRDDYAMALAIDAGDVVLAGHTDKITGASDFASSRVYLGTIGLTRDAFVTRLAPAVLPVELLYFTGRCEPPTPTLPKERGVVLNWATASEFNNDYFTIEQSFAPSPSGEGWGEVGKVKGAGNSSTFRSYEFTDFPFSFEEGQGVRYYRLKQTDYDGKYEYSPIAPVRFPCQDEGVIILPNPSPGIFSAAGLSTNSEISVFNVMGEKIFSRKSNNEIITVDMTDRSEGVYFIQIKTGKEAFIKKLIIQK